MGLCPHLFFIAHTNFFSSGRLWVLTALLLGPGDVIWVEETSFTFSFGIWRTFFF